MPILSQIKRSVMPSGSSPHTILTGAYRGLRMNIDLQSNSQLWVGTFEREVGPWLRRLANGIKTGIDIGAGHGEYTLFLLRKTSAKHVHAFEPDPVTMSSLRSNLILNDSEETGRLTTYSRFVGEGRAEGEISLDQLASKVEGPCLVKIDVEGHEPFVLKGARRLLAEYETRWIIETHSVEAERDCLAILRDAGYTAKVIDRSWWRGILPERRLIPHNRWLVAWKESPERRIS